MVAREKTDLKVLEGAEELISEWGYALDELAFNSKEGFNDFREIENDAAKHWFKTTVGKLPKVKTAYEAVVKYRDLADERKVISKENFKLEEKGDTILGTFLSHDCPYRNCCIERKRENKQFVCFRATPFVVAVRLMADKEYKADVIYEQTNPGKVCMLKGIPTQISFKVGLSYKLGKGNIKINDIDCSKLGIDVIDTVTVAPSRKEIAGRTMTLMSASQTKYPAGMIVMNIGDAKTLGLEEKDTIYIRKAKEGEEVKLVDSGEYGGKPGEYDQDYNIKGLEVEKKEQPEETNDEKPVESGEEKKDITKGKKAKRQSLKENSDESAEPTESVEEAEQPKEESSEKLLKKSEEGLKKSKASPKEKKDLKKTKTSNMNVKQTRQQMKDFESKIDALRNEKS